MTKDKMFSIRFEPETERKIRQEASSLNLEISEYLRLAFNVGRPTVLEYPILTAIKLDDARFKK